MYKIRIPKNLSRSWLHEDAQTAEEMLQWITDNAQREISAAWVYDTYYITDKQKTLFDMLWAPETQKVIWSKLQNSSYSEWYSSLWEPVQAVQLEMFTESEMSSISTAKITPMDLVYSIQDIVA